MRMVFYYNYRDSKGDFTLCVCLCMEDKERGVLGIEWLLSAVH